MPASWTGRLDFWMPASVSVGRKKKRGLGASWPERNKPWKFKHLTVNQVYWPLAKSSGRTLALTKAQRASSTERHQKLHQFLSQVGVKALRQHLGQLLGIAQVSSNQAEYEKHVGRAFADQHAMEL